jgi:hypothetical protein
MARPGPKKVGEQLASLADELPAEVVHAARYVAQLSGGRVAFSATQVATFARVGIPVATRAIEVAAELRWCRRTNDEASGGGWLWIGELGKGRT